MADLTDALAQDNLDRVEILYTDLAFTAEHNGLTTTDVAALMGLDEEVVVAIFAGERDLTISDLQVLALAVGAHLSFSVTN